MFLQLPLLLDVERSRHRQRRQRAAGRVLHLLNFALAHNPRPPGNFVSIAARNPSSARRSRLFTVD